MKINQKQKNIPDGWKWTRLEEIGNAYIGLTYSPKDISNKGTLVLRSSNIKDGKINYSDCVFVDKDNITKKNIVQTNDILICARNGSKKLIGKNALIGEKDSGHAFGAFMSVFRTKNHEYMYQLFQSQIYKKEINKDLGPTINQVTTGNLLKFKFILPSVSEQNRIVNVLETWDETIETISKSIEIKKEIKKCLIQELLTGKKRLNEFNDKWETFELGDISKMGSGGTPKSTNESYYGGSIPWVSIADMTANGKYIYSTLKKLTEAGLENSSAKIYPKGTILYAMYASIGECSIAGIEMSSSQAILGITPDKTKLDSIFLYYYLLLTKEKIKLQGQQGTQSNLNAGMVRKFVLDIPDLKEQKAIAEILNTADEEIQTLEEKLSFIKEQKRYLLNNLVTGQIRTPEDLLEKIN